MKIIYEIITRDQMRNNKDLNLCSVSKNEGKILNTREVVKVK